MMGDRYKAIKQKWEIGWITTDVGSSWIIINYDEYKLKALHQKKNRSSNVAVRKQNKYQSQCYWHLTI